MAAVAATLSDSMCRPSGMVNRQAACLIVWEESPRLSFPSATIIRFGIVRIVSISTARPSGFGGKQHHALSGEALPSSTMNTGRESSAALVARTTLGL